MVEINQSEVISQVTNLPWYSIVLLIAFVIFMLFCVAAIWYSLGSPVGLGRDKP